MAKVTVSSLIGETVYLDANILIYAVERHPLYIAVLDPLFALFDKGQAIATTSELTLAECLVKPFSNNDLQRQQLYNVAVSSRKGFNVLPVSRAILLRAAQLRAAYKPRLPDAIHLATALDSGCTAFVTNDQLVAPVPGIAMRQLADLTT